MAFRDPWTARVERAEALRAQLADAQAELAGLDRELGTLRRQWARACRWGAAPSASGRFRMGVLVGALFAGLSPFVLLSLLAGAGFASTIFELLGR